MKELHGESRVVAVGLKDAAHASFRGKTHQVKQIIAANKSSQPAKKKKPEKSTKLNKNPKSNALGAGQPTPVLRFRPFLGRLESHGRVHQLRHRRQRLGAVHRLARRRPEASIWFRRREKTKILPAVGNGTHFCDTTERASQRRFSSYKGGFPCITEVGRNPLIPQPCPVVINSF